jgi:hypothetical protein
MKGLPRWMLGRSLGDKPHGYHVEWDPQGGKPIEHDTYTCQHCGVVTIVRRDTPQAWCKRCMAMVCEACAPKGACHPQHNPNRLEWMEATENRARLRRIIDLGHE